MAPYEIQIHSLDDKLYTYDFEGGNEFFEVFDVEDSKEGSFTAKLNLVKSATMLQLKFGIKASLLLQCDRSLEDFKEDIQIEEKYIFKFGDRSEVVSEDMEVIPFGTTEINIAQHLYDFIALAIPVKKIHPSLRDEDDDEEGAYIFIEGEEKNKGAKQDPRWDALADLKSKLEDN